jgi:hypothetical protein
MALHSRSCNWCENFALVILEKRKNRPDEIVVGDPISAVVMEASKCG